MAELEGFPSKDDLPRTWFREHANRPGQSDRGCWWFHGTEPGTAVEGRFDLPVPHGTLYLGETSGVAVRERCGRFLAGHQPVAQTHLQGRVVTTVQLPAVTEPVADATSPDAALFGVTAELASGNDYRLTAAWAAAWFDAGYEGGVYYAPRFTPAHEHAVGLFGPAGTRDWPVVGTVSLAHALASLGYDLTRSRIPSAAAAAPDDEAEPEDA